MSDTPTPPPDVPRDSKPGRKTPSNKKREEFIEFTALLVGKDLPKSQIKRHIKEKFQKDLGKTVSARTCEDYIARAKELLVEWSERPVKDHFVEAVAFYKSVIQEPGSSRDQKMRARERIDNLYGLEAPKALKVSANVATTELSEEELLKLVVADLAQYPQKPPAKPTILDGPETAE